MPPTPRFAHPDERFDLVQDYVAVYFPCFQGFLREELGAAALELANPAATRRLVEVAMSSEEGRRGVEEMFYKLLARLPENARPRLNGALTQPFDRDYARQIRGEVARMGAEASEAWGAVLGLARAADVTPFDRRQLKAFALKPWLDVGLAKYPVPVPLPCPGCQKHAQALVTLSRLAQDDNSWRIACPHCGFEDCNATEPHSDADGYFTEPEVRAWLGKSPAVQGSGPASRARQDALLQRLQPLLARFDEALADEVESRSTELRKSWSPEGTVRQLSGGCHFYPSDDLAAIKTMTRHTFGSRGAAAFWETDLDKALERVPLAQTSLKTTSPAHPALHWRQAYDARLTELRGAVGAGDALEAAVQALLLVENCRCNGLLTSIALSVPEPPATPQPSGVWATRGPS